MTRGQVAGVDCSTQSTKVVVVSVDDGRIVATGEAPHTVAGERGARETDPRQWWDALAGALAATGRAGDIAAIAVAGQQHGLVTARRDGEPLRPALLWNDTRAAPQAAELVDALGGPGAWAERIGVVPVPSITVAKWAWLRAADPDVARAAEVVCLPHDWLTSRLTGEVTTDRGDASGTGWWSAVTGSLDADVLGLDAVRLEASRLPVVRRPDEPAGVVTARAAEALGLRAGTIVGPGTGDNMGAALGLALAPGTPVVSLGTSGTAYAVSERPARDPSGVVAGFCDATGRWLPLACTLNCTLAVDRVAAWLGRDRDAIAPATEVTLLPYFDGERTPNRPAATGTLVGLTHATDPGEILRAAYEGATAALMSALGAIDAHGSGLDPDAPLVLVGGGARGAAWREVVGALSGRPLRVPPALSHVAIGAAAQAAACLGGEDPLAVAGRWGHGRGEDVPARPRDAAALARIERIVTRAEPLLADPR